MSDSPETLPVPGSTGFDDPAQAAVLQKMVANGETVADAAPIDFFAFTEVKRYDLPGPGGQWIEIRVMNEGARKAYLNSVNREVKVIRGTGDAVMKLQQAEDRAQLIKHSIANWNLYRGGKLYGFDKKQIAELLELFPPDVMDGFEKFIRKNNPWLEGDVTVEDIDREISELQERRERLIAEQEAKS